MRLIGANTIRDVVPEMVDLRALHTHNGLPTPGDGSSVLDVMDKSRL